MPTLHEPVKAVWLNANIATMTPGSEYGEIEDGAIAAAGDRIAWVGRREALPSQHARGARIHDCERRWITPGLIDCHTHLVYAGNRAREFEERLKGASYEEIAGRGGGIVSTVLATR